MNKSTIRELCEQAMRPDSRDSMAASQELDKRCDPQTMLAVVEALTLADLNYSRTNHSQPDMMGDDEHEAWGAIKSALAALNRTP